MLKGGADLLNSIGAHAKHNDMRSLPGEANVVAGKPTADTAEEPVLAWILKVPRITKTPAGAKGNQLRVQVHANG
jgi:hypothetical protein